jgi:hypothetical protein
MMVGRLSALHTGRLYPSRNIPRPVRGCLRQTQGHSTAGIKNSDDTIRKRTHDFPACSVMPQPTAPPHASMADELEYIWSTEGVILIKERIIMGGNAVPISLRPPQNPRADCPRIYLVPPYRQDGDKPPATGMARPILNKGSSTRLRLCIIAWQQTKRKFISSARNRL